MLVFRALDFRSPKLVLDCSPHEGRPLLGLSIKLPIEPLEQFVADYYLYCGHDSIVYCGAEHGINPTGAVSHPGHPR